MGWMPGHDLACLPIFPLQRVSESDTLLMNPNDATNTQRSL